MGRCHSSKVTPVTPILIPSSFDKVDDRIEDGQDAGYIEFHSPCFYALESDRKVKIKVMRIGSCKSKSMVQLRRTYDDKPCSSVELTFEEGEELVEFVEPLTTDGIYELRPTIQLALLDPIGARLGPLTHATVSVTNSDKFPGTDKKDTDFTVVRKFLWSQIKMRRQKFRLAVCALLFLGIFPVWESLSLKLMIDLAFDNVNVEDNQNALWIAGVHLIFFFMNIFAEFLLAQNAGNSGVKSWLRFSLIQHYLNLSDHDSQGLSEGQVVNDMVFTVEQVCDECWAQFLLCIRFASTLVASFSLQVWLLRGKVPLYFFLPPLLVLPPIMFLVICWRDKWSDEKTRSRKDAEDNWVEEVIGLVRDKPLIAAFGTSDQVVSSFKQTYKTFADRASDLTLFQQRSEWIPRFLSIFVLFAVYAAAPTLASSYSITPGDFASLIKAWISFRDSSDNMFTRSLLVERGSVSIRKLADLLKREDKATAKCAQHSANGSMTFLSSSPNKLGDRRRFDEIQFEGVKFDYICQWTGHRHCVISDANFMVPCCGKLFVVRSAIGGGKSTLVRLLAGVVLPTYGRISVPPNKRSFLVERRAKLVAGSILKNLRFGMRCVQGEDDNTTTDGDCWAVAKRAGLSDYLLHNTTFVIDCHVDMLCDKDVAAIILSQAILAQTGLLCVNHLGDAMGGHWTLEYLLPLLELYASGGLTAVLTGNEKALEGKPVMFRPTVIWNTYLKESEKVQDAFVIEGGRVSVASPNACSGACRGP